MKISILETYSSRVVAQEEISWDELKKLFSKHETRYTSKKDVPMFSAAEFKPGQPHSNNTAIQAHLGVIDLDDVSLAQMRDIEKKLEETSYISYTSWSHSREKELNDQHRVRFLFPLSRPVDKLEWSKFWNKLNLYFDKVIDQSAKDIQRGYYFPAVDGDGPHWIKQHEGNAFDVDWLLNQDFSGIKKLDSEDLRQLAYKLQRRLGDSSKGISQAILQALKGNPIAPIGERDNMLFKIAHAIVKEFPTCDIQNVTNIFLSSIAVMQLDNPSSNKPGWFEDKLRRAKEQLLEEKQAIQAELDNAIAQKILVAFGSDAQRTHPYTPEELQSFYDDAECNSQQFKKRWIIHSCGTYYIFFNGSYLPPITEKDLLNACDTFLAPAITAGVSTEAVRSRGNVTAKSITELTIDYGSPCFTIEADLTVQKSKYNEKIKTFIEATAPRRNIQPKYDPLVEKYIELLAGEQEGQLKDFMASITDLSRPSVALYLHSDAGYGKSLLFDGLARIWGQGAPPKLGQAMGEGFNETLSRCPLIVADEVMPSTFRKNGNTGELREFIQAETRQLRRKFKLEMQLKGCIRLILAANNADLLGTHEDLSQEDINAIAGRFLYINCNNKEVKEFLEGLGWDTVASFIKDDRIAAYALWLVENRVIENKSRFIIDTTNSQFHRRMAIGTGLPSNICHWLVSYLQSPAKVDAQSKGQVLVRDNEIYVTAKALNDYWTMYDTHTLPPTPSKTSKALIRICKKEKKSIKINKEVLRFWHVDFDNLVAWAEMNNYSTRDELLSLTSVNTIVRGEQKPPPLPRDIQ